MKSGLFDGLFIPNTMAPIVAISEISIIKTISFSSKCDVTNPLMLLLWGALQELNMSRDKGLEGASYQGNTATTAHAMKHGKGVGGKEVLPKTHVHIKSAQF